MTEKDLDFTTSDLQVKIKEEVIDKMPNDRSQSENPFPPTNQVKLTQASKTCGNMINENQEINKEKGDKEDDPIQLDANNSTPDTNVVEGSQTGEENPHNQTHCQLGNNTNPKPQR